MTSKLLEVRDRHTTVPVLAIQVSGEDGPLMRRAGFDSPMIYLVALAVQKCQYDPWAWNDRTMKNAHLYIEREWERLGNGDVVDVEFLLGEVSKPKVSESASW